MNNIITDTLPVLNVNYVLVFLIGQIYIEKMLWLSSSNNISESFLHLVLSFIKNDHSTRAALTDIFGQFLKINCI